MSNTYTQIHVQAIFAVQNRDCIITPDWEEDLYKYITGIVQKEGHKMLQINGMPDHVHLLFGLRPNQSISDLMRIVKTNSSKWINEQQFLKTKFSWQAGYGAFSYSKSQIPQVFRYIQIQKQHHQKRTFREEYLDILKKSGIDFDARYIFKEII